MNNNYHTPAFDPSNPGDRDANMGAQMKANFPQGAMIDFPSSVDISTLPKEQYIENIITNNIGALVTIHATFPGSEQYRDKSFTGVIKGAARDNILLGEPKTGETILIPTVYINFVVFHESFKLDAKSH